jgi:gliding motility-associated-like protein
MVPVLCDTDYIIVFTQDTLNWLGTTVGDLLCFGDSNGIAIVEVTGGLEPYQFTWNTTPVQTGPVAFDLKAGNYIVMVTDSLNDTLYIPVTISSPTALTATAVTKDPSCFGKFDGNIAVTVNGGTSPYTYFWSNGSIFNPLTNLSAGNFTLTITDTNGCKLNKNYTLKEPNPISLVLDSINDAVCKTTSDGSISLSLVGGTAPFNYFWNTGETTLDIANKIHGEYSIVVTDKNNCGVTGKYTINYKKDNCEQDVFMPQGFSPDGDGINDGYTIDGIEKFPNNHLRIYNRWGTLVFEEKGYKNTWKGTFEKGIGANEETLPTGTYFYVLELEPGKPAISGYLYISK